MARYLPFGPLDRSATEEKVEKLSANTDPEEAEQVLSLAVELEGTVVEWSDTGIYGLLREERPAS